MSFGFVMTIALIVIVGWLCWYFWLVSKARQSEEVVVALTPQRALDVANLQFPSMRWKEASGSAPINKKARVFIGSATRQARDAGGLGPTISIVVEPTENGSTVVGVWMSGWITQLGIPYAVGVAQRQKKKVITALSAADATSTENRSAL